MTSWNPGDQQSGQQPGYGQQPGQQPPAPNFDKGTPPSYGQPAPQPPAYGQQPPAYGQQQPPAYGQQQPTYGGNAYGAPPANPYGNNPYGGAQGGGLPPGAVGPLSMGNRVVAYVIDGIILYAVGAVAAAVLFFGILGSSGALDCGTTYDANGYPNYNCTGGGGAGAGIIITFVIFLILWIGVLIAWIYMAGVKGQTPGKKIMGVKVVDNDSGQPIGMGRAFLRYLVQGLTNYLCFAGLWSAWLDGPPEGRYRAWHDKAVNSVVISVK